MAGERVLMVAGERSGDLLAAALARDLRARAPDLRLEAMGGAALREAGADIVVDNRSLAVVGLVEVLRHYPRIRRALKTLERRLTTHRPDLLVLVDYVEFNLRLARRAKALGIPVLFYVSPQVWAWRPGRVHEIGRRIDMMAVIFPFEVDFYRRHGIPVRYVGNPLPARVRPTLPRDVALARFGLRADAPVLGLQPGSRRGEIERLLPTFAATAARLRAARPELQLVLPVAAGIEPDFVRRHLPADLPVQLVTDASPYDVMQVCTAILTASGTATLETALMQVPMVIAYRVAPLSYAILRRLIRVPHIGLVNIVAQAGIVPEFVQHAATPERLAAALAPLLDDTPERRAMVARLAEVRRRLTDRREAVALDGLVLEMLGRSPDPA